MVALALAPAPFSAGYGQIVDGLQARYSVRARLPYAVTIAILALASGGGEA